MRRSIGILSLGVVVTMAAACSGGGEKAASKPQAPRTALGPANAATPSTASSVVNRKVIVILRDQMPGLNPGRGARHVRAEAIAASQASILGRLQAAQPRSVHSFENVNAFATTLSQAEVDQLSVHPLVVAVVPDRVIPTPVRPPRAGVRGGAKAGSAERGGSGAALCNTLEPEALQLTNTAFLDPSTPQAQEVIDGAGERVTGRGVKVAVVADGIDTTVPGFTRPDGSKVFIDYQSFTGDPAGTPTQGGEAFGDASSIAAQDTPNGQVLQYDISKFVNVAHPLPSPCNIRVRGVAPGASLVGLDVYSDLGYTSFASTWVQAIDWAVVHDEVDVINESFGSNVYPDDANDPISLANQAAVRAGIVVVASTGDASANTLASPANNPWVIGAGATTQFRLYAQMSFTLPLATGGFVDDNISAFSSSGYAQRRPGTVDIVAPGDLGWALCSTNPTLYTDCTDNNGNATPLQIFGGTSEAAPLTSAAAALVIQAYRSTHGGASPTPALVKSILQSSATDLGAPSDEQGAGLLDTLKAVDTALSIQDGNGAPPPRGDGLLASPNSASFTAEPGDGLERTFQITNTGTSAIDVQPALETLGPPIAGGGASLTLNQATDASFVDGYGYADPYVTQTFTVPEGADHVDAAIAWTGTVAGQQTLAQLYLIDPKGRLVAYSYPQGTGQAYGHVDAVAPTPGTWTAVISTYPSSVSIGYSGAVQFSWSAKQFAPIGSVSPRRLTLPPGGTAFVTAELDAPAQPGDFAAALRLHGSGSTALAEIPFTVQTLIPVGQNGGTFTGTITGGNGRAYVSPEQTYAFDVPEGVRDMALTLQVPDNGYLLAGYLVDPNGMILSSGSNVDPTGAQQYALQLFHEAPQAGRWRFLLLEPQASGNQTSIGFTARIAFDAASFSAPSLPASPRTVISASAPPFTVALELTNTGALAKAFFADARLAETATVTLPEYSCGATTMPGFCSYVELPPRATGLRFVAQASAPIQMNALALQNSPVLWAQPSGNGAVTATLEEPEVVFGPWSIYPDLIGPFGPAGAQTTPVTTSAVATMQPFDSSVTASSGNVWADVTNGTTTFNPAIVPPGAAATINLTFAPPASQVGQVVRGVVYLETLNELDEWGVGDEVASLPYAYTVVP